ncbi:MAG: hypothetical protein H0V73_11380, partial [Chloroflexi bacterium]|nr:hypothetical protein [Chloroflexota bacterium]
MNRRKLTTATAVVVLVTGLMAGALGSVLAASPGPGQNFFELDASQDQSNGAAPKAAVTDNATTGLPDDWDRICKNVTVTLDTTSAILDQCTGAGADHSTARSFDSETTATGTANNATIFTGGGSKDQQNTTNWSWKDGAGGLPDKDNLLHAMTARYGTGAASHIYFAADRYDNSGDAQIGFWFFNNQIAPLANGSFGPGSHKAGVVPHDATNAGDILVLSDFTNGGTQPTIRVYEYVGSGGSDGSLNLLGGNTTDIRDCGIVATDDFCASVNNVDGAVAPWLYKNKSGQTSFGHGEFYEGGLNLTSLGLQNECFSSFLAETRSAQSVTATLKDFVSGPFQDCNSSVVTTPSEGQNGTTALGTDGTITVHDTAAVAINGTVNFSATLSFALCGPIATGNCVSGGTPVLAKSGVNPITANGNYDSADVVLTTVGRYCWRAVLVVNSPTGIAGQSDPASGSTSTTECFTLTPAQPTISTQASASVEVGNPIDDTATLAGTSLDPDGSKADGTITFKLYGPDDATCATVIETSVVTLTNGGDGNYLASAGVLSGTLGTVSIVPTTAGTYRWVASYSGDAPNTLKVDGACNAANESVVVTPGQPAITTQATSAAGSPVGTAIDDTAHLTGTKVDPDGTMADGTITFRLYGPNDATCATVIETSVVTLTNGGDGFYKASDGVLSGTLGSLTPTAAGTYRWIASYSGDLPNTLSVTGACNDANEASLIISLTPSMVTSQSFIPNDSATVTVAAGGGNLAGSVSFQVFESSDCSGTAIYSQSVSVAGASPQTVNTTNT